MKKERIYIQVETDTNKLQVIPNSTGKMVSLQLSKAYKDTAKAIETSPFATLSVEADSGRVDVCFSMKELGQFIKELQGIKSSIEQTPLGWLDSMFADLFNCKPKQDIKPQPHQSKRKRYDNRRKKNNKVSH